jgi:hypothetical protein
MLSETEDKCMALICDFARNNSDFRPVPIEDRIDGVFDHIEEDRLLFLLKGSYKTRMLILGIMVSHDLTEFQYQSNTSVFYIMSCSASMAASLEKETTADRITKEIGLKIEMEVGIKEIDDNYLINCSEPEKLKTLIKQPVAEEFFKTHINGFEAITIKNGIIIYRRNFAPAKETTGLMEKDIEDICAIAQAAEALI